MQCLNLAPRQLENHPGVGLIVDEGLAVMAGVALDLDAVLRALDAVNDGHRGRYRRSVAAAQSLD